MSNYTKITNFTTKDTLPSGNASKVVKGTEIDNEFTAISSAIATKADTASPAFTGVPTASTATAGTSTTQLATTAFATVAIQAIYPVGSIYINAAVATNPATLLGFGTWTAFAAGRVLVGLNGANAAFDTVEETGGSADDIVVSHTHTYSSTTSGQSNSHNHTFGGDDQIATQGGYTVVSNFAYDATSTASSGGVNMLTTNASTDHTHTVSGTTASAGASGTNANLQPYIVVYMWKRTA
jgi:hypothetical protein